MDIGQANCVNGGAVVEPRQPFKPFARPRMKRRRVTPTKPTLFAVRPNPSHYVLNFSEHAKTVERAVSSLIQSDIRKVSVVGLPGSGKTVVLRGVAYHPSVYSYFPHGVCFVQLTSETTVDTLFSHFCEIVSRMHGKSTSDRVKSLLCERKHNSAMEVICRFLRERRFLLILDNVSDSVKEVIQLLSQLVAEASLRGLGRFTVLAATRSVDIARQFGGNSVLHLELHEACGETARNILCAHAGFSRPSFDAACRKNDSAALQVLRKCSGLPLAIAIAGGAIKRLLKDAKSSAATDQIWVQYKTYLFNNFDQFGEISGLFKGLTSCRLTVEYGEDWNAKITVLDVLCSLSIAKYGVWIPFQVLQRLWGIKKKEDVALIVRPLSRVCLVSREQRRGSAGISIPDIIIDFCDHIARKSSGKYKWIVKLLYSYSGSQPGKANGGMKKGKEDGGMLNTSFDEDQYLQESLAHHLAKALATSSGDKAEESCLKEAVNIIQSRIAQKYEMRKQNWGKNQR